MIIHMSRISQFENTRELCPLKELSHEMELAFEDMHGQI
jgi:hypothetical protein